MCVAKQQTDTCRECYLLHHYTCSGACQDTSQYTNCHSHMWVGACLVQEFLYLDLSVTRLCFCVQLSLPGHQPLSLLQTLLESQLPMDESSMSYTDPPPPVPELYYPPLHPLPIPPSPHSTLSPFRPLPKTSTEHVSTAHKKYSDNGLLPPHLFFLQFVHRVL